MQLSHYIYIQADAIFGSAEPIETSCSYQPPDRCNGSTPLSCCERVAAAAGAARAKTSVAMGSMMLLLVSIAL